MLCIGYTVENDNNDNDNEDLTRDTIDKITFPFGRQNSWPLLKSPSRTLVTLTTEEEMASSLLSPVFYPVVPER